MLPRLFGGHTKGDVGSIAPPWDASRRSVYSRIQQAEPDRDGWLEIDEQPPDEEVLRFAPGMEDTLFGAPDSDRKAVTARKLVSALSNAVLKPSAETLAHLYALAMETSIVSIIDDTLRRVAASALPPIAVASLARRLALEAPDVEPVKLGIALLGISGNENDYKLLLDLGRFDEFTLYSGIALQNLLSHSEPHIWQLAKGVRGWGRIRAIFLLGGTNDPQIKNWLLREGFKNSIMTEESAYFCAVQGSLLHALLPTKIDDEMIEAAGELLAALICGGPAEDMRDYADGAEASRLFIQHVRMSEKLTFSRFLSVQTLRQEADDESDDSRCANWPAEAKWQVRTGSAEYLGRADWRSLTVDALADPRSDHEFWQAARVAEALEIDSWPFRFERQKARRAEEWFFLMQAKEADRIEKVLDLARSQLDLDRIASGPGLSHGFGPGHQDENALDFILQDLKYFSGLGWDLIRVGLNSRIIRTRLMALRVLAAWGRAAWPDDAEAILWAALKIEPDDQLREDIRKVISGQSIEPDFSD